ncbi:hypothetical protein TNIN_91801 [Trichonephila inaurata madagascariensis]|uniref:Uncharacterized protein n=1 Tax=Trichonephila inaurata madagascariensis TaxID=2747483 RepID=A0A8X6YWH1_9ARAC|nr:hypothetical protein TNIN_91801 [Trichonephila inaurata madagascariensis]
MQVFLGGYLCPYPILKIINQEFPDTIKMEYRIPILTHSNNLRIRLQMVEQVIQQDFSYHKFSSQWVSLALNAKQKSNWMAVCLKHGLFSVLKATRFLNTLL